MIATRHDHPETSHAAAASIGAACRRRVKEWVFLAVARYEPITAKRLEPILGRLASPEGIRGALGVLEAENRVYHMHKMRNPSGRLARAWWVRRDRRAT